MKKTTKKKVPHPGIDVMILAPPERLSTAVADYPDIVLSVTHCMGGGCAGSSARVSTRLRW